MGMFDWKDSGNANEGSYSLPGSEAYTGAAPEIPMTGAPVFGPMGTAMSALGVDATEKPGDFSASLFAPSTIGSKPTPQGDDFLYGDASVNRLGIPGLEVGAGVGGTAQDVADGLGLTNLLNQFGMAVPNDVFSGRATAGGWDTEDGSRAGLRGNIAALPRQDELPLGGLISPIVGSILGPSFAFDPTALTAEVEGPNAEAELSLGTDGFTAGAQATGAGVGVTMGDFGDTGVGSDSEQQLRVAVSEGAGAAFRLHWADEDKDGTRELGFGLDGGFIGKGSMDFKTEDPLRSVLGFGNPLATSILPEGNLTNQGLDAVDGMIMNGGDAVVDWVNDLFTDDNQGLEPF